MTKVTFQVSETVVLTLLLFFSAHSLAEPTPQVPFEPSLKSMAPLVQAKHVEKTFGFRDFDILLSEKVVQVGRNPAVDARIQVKRADKVLTEVAFKSLEPLSGVSGLRTEQRQSLDELFLVERSGNYDDGIVIITERGKILDIPDGDIYLSQGKKLLFSLRNSTDGTMIPGFAIVDYKNDKSLISLKGAEVGKLFEPGFSFIFTEVDGYFLGEAFRNLGSTDPKAKEESRFVVFDPKDKSLKRYDRVEDLPMKDRKQVTELSGLGQNGMSTWVPIR